MKKKLKAVLKYKSGDRKTIEVPGHRGDDGKVYLPEHIKSNQKMFLLDHIQPTPSTQFEYSEVENGVPFRLDLH